MPAGSNAHAWALCLLAYSVIQSWCPDKERVYLMLQRRFVSNAPFVFGLSVSVTAFLLIVAFARHGYDDPYITYRYTSNLLQGKGFVYNVGDRVLSTTAPGYALLLVPVGLALGDIPLAGNVLSAVGLGLGAMSIFLWAREAMDGNLWIGWVAGLLLLTFPLCVSSFGSEMCAYLGLTIAGFYAYARQRPARAMAWMAVATLVRPDGALAAALIMLHLLVIRRRLPWKPAAVYAIILLPWVVYATWTYGSPIPVTLSAKQAQGRMLISDSYLVGAWKMVVGYAQRPLYWLYLPLGALGAWRLVRTGRTWWLLIGWTICSFLAYVVMGVTRYFWYYVPLVPGVVLLVALGVDWIRARLPALRMGARMGRLAQWVLPAALLALLLAPNLQSLYNWHQHPDARLAIYRQLGQWIEAHLPQEVSVGTIEIGIIGYYSQRRIIDFAGLIQPEVHEHMSRESTYYDTATWAVQTYRPDVLVLRRDWFPSWQEDVLASCRSRQDFLQQGTDFEFTIYECHWAE